MSEGRTILYLRTDLSNSPLIAGGSVAHTLGVLQGFLDLGYSVVCASSLMHTQLEHLPLMHVQKLKNPNFLAPLRWRLNCLFSSFIFAYQAQKIVRQFKPARMYQRYSLLNGTGVLLRLYNKLPLALEYNGSEVWVDRQWGARRLFRLTWLARLVEWINLRYADHIIVVSQVLHDELVARGVPTHKIVINPNGVDTESYNPAQLLTERDSVRMQLGVEATFVFCFVGTFSVWHGIETLAAMVPRIVARKRQAHFLFIGDGPQRAWLERELQAYKDYVTFTGLVAQHETKKYLAAADAFLSPTRPNKDGSRFFGSPTKLFEYMSMAKPVIASDLEQLAQIISPALRVPAMLAVTDEVGIVVAPDDVDGFVDAALLLMAMPAVAREKLGANARAKAVAEYQWTAHVRRIIRCSSTT